MSDAGRPSREAMRAAAEELEWRILHLSTAARQHDAGHRHGAAKALRGVIADCERVAAWLRAGAGEGGDGG